LHAVRKALSSLPDEEPAGIKGAELTKVLSGIVDILRGNAGSVEAEAWRPLTPVSFGRSQ
jgi:hypothetical protein